MIPMDYQQFDDGHVRLRTSVRKFAAAMEMKLRRDDSKKEPWEIESPLTLLDRLIDEVAELEGADNLDDEMAEAVDVANFAMMIFCVSSPELRHLVRGHDPGPAPFRHGDPGGMPSDRAIMRGAR